MTSTPAKPKTTRRRTTSATTRKTTKAATTARKPRATPKPAAAAPAPAPAAPSGDMVTIETPKLAVPGLRKKELIDRVVERSGVKKRDAKPAIEAALAIIGEALAEGRALNLRPMGNVKVRKMKKGPNGQVMNARVRRPGPAPKPGATPDSDDGTKPLAQAAE